MGSDSVAGESLLDGLKAVREQLLAMGGEVESQLRSAISGLVHRDLDVSEIVLGGDHSINRYHVQLDKECYELLVGFRGNAQDIRTIVANIKINNELERIGDFAVKVAETTFRYLEHDPVKPLIDIPRMADVAQGMLRDSLNAYVEQSTEIAQRVISRDATVDGLHEQISRELLGVMMNEQKHAAASLNLLSITNCLERVGDHATNIAEDVIYMVTGRDVRHQGTGGFTDA